MRLLAICLGSPATPWQARRRLPSPSLALESHCHPYHPNPTCAVHLRRNSLKACVAPSASVAQNARTTETRAALCTPLQAGSPFPATLKTTSRSLSQHTKARTHQSHSPLTPLLFCFLYIAVSTALLLMHAWPCLALALLSRCSVCSVQHDPYPSHTPLASHIYSYSPINPIYSNVQRYNKCPHLACFGS